MSRKIQGTVVLSKRQSFFGQNLSFSLHLISAHNPTSPENGSKGEIGKGVDVEERISKMESWTAGEVSYRVEFEWEDKVGIPEAFLIINKHEKQFFLVSLTLESVPNQADIHFPCNSWIFHKSRYTKDRVFFANKTYVPSQTPKGLVEYRKEELENLRGNGEGVQLQKWDRVYDYAPYNDLGNPDMGQHHARPILGGESSEYPYPRRARTGRPPTKSDPKSESKVGSSESIYVPRDERFTELKKKDFDTYKNKSAINVGIHRFESIFNWKKAEFNSFNDVVKLYKGRLKYPKGFKNISEHVPAIMKQDFQIESEHVFKFPIPQVIAANEIAWMSDEEFAREMLAGVNPVKICCLQEFPPRSKLDKSIYGDHSSTITRQQIENNLDGLTLKQALADRKLFVLDYHDDFMPYLRQINDNCAKGYASRTILFLKTDGTLKPLAIELSVPHPHGDQFGASSKVYLPAEHGVQNSIWKLAKAYVAVNDSSYHQLISHWLNTHAVIEPFVIATHRQLSVLHPIYKLLVPHFRDTIKINSLARKTLINQGGTIESTFFPGKYAMEISSMMYKNWVFPEQALPVDLIKRGMAIEDPTSPIGTRLVIEDYPYAVDGLEIWFCIKEWVEDYCSIYYKEDDDHSSVKKDYELEKWWKELVGMGHGDKKHEPWWPKMKTRKELIESCTIIIWIASALHAAVNFGQYSYAGFILNRPTLSRKYMPESGTLDYNELEINPEKAFLKTITSKEQTLKALSVIGILSEHSYDELYIGQRDNPNWTCDKESLEAFEKFGKRLREIENNIKRRNSDERLKNRYGPAKIHYTSLSPYSEHGITGKGIPNSISM